jgi:aminopeptidase N
MVAKAAHEFGANNRTEQYVAAGEKLFGPYQWGRYDILILPPSFPYGGMENPTLTFVTPALLVGDQSLTDVVAHGMHTKFISASTRHVPATQRSLIAGSET